MKITSSTIKAVEKILSAKPAKYASRQLDDVLKFGKTRQYPNVSEEILDKYAPYRRLSKKKCTLSDGAYFINKFEKESPLEIPKMWEQMSDADKVDFIVKNRYEKLLSYRIMNDIKNSKVEKSFILSTDGKIKYYGTENSSRHCSAPLDLRKDSIHIHNHPVQFTKCDGFYEYSDLPQVNANSRPFSISDIINSISGGVRKSYVVDSKGIQFQLIPKRGKCDNFFNVESLMDDLRHIQYQAFDGTRSVEAAFRKNYIDGIRRIKQDGHDFRILNFWDFDKF